MSNQDTVPVDKLVEQYIKLRDKIEAITKRHKDELAPYKEAEVKLERFLLGFLQTNGLDSIKTPAGTPYKKTHTSVTLDDKPAYLDWIKVNDKWEFLDVRPLKDPIIDHLKETQALPPGVKYTESVVVNVTRNSKKAD